MTSLVNLSACFGLDLPGCGLSRFSPTPWDCYSLEAMAELIGVFIADQCRQNPGQGVVLIGHSMGCSLSVLLASPNSILRKRGVEILGLISICPRASTPSDPQIKTYERLLSIPTPIFDVWRRWDRRGGPDSPSVARFVGSDADLETKNLQVRFNTQSNTQVWRRMAWGTLPKRSPGGETYGGLPGLNTWAKLTVPLFLIAGESDTITKPDEVALIVQALGKTWKSQVPDLFHSRPTVFQEKSNYMALGVDEEGKSHVDQSGQPNSITEKTILNGDCKAPGGAISNTSDYSKKRQALKTSILPHPASHALLYDTATYRTLAGLIQSFLSKHIDSRLSLGWQLQHLSTEGKWDVKNLAKWQAVRPVSEPIAGTFRAMKTLREVDEVHSPERFVKSWKGKLKAVIDISHESPVYDPKGLSDGEVEYHKFPTVSKIPPTEDEVKGFIKLVDSLQKKSPNDTATAALIGVHCHYGFNRTGFFICSYLIEKEGYGVQQAIDEFQENRPPGIRHEHFLDTLFVRYCIGLKRAPTL